MSTLTKQQVFSRVYHHFIDMGSARGLSDGEHCLFRGTHGSRCAVGLFMTDEEARAADNRSLGVTVILRTGGCVELEGQDPHFISDLQCAHDSGISTLKFEKNLHFVAQKYNLLVVGIPKEMASPAVRSGYVAGRARIAMAKAHGLAVCSCGALGAQSWNGRWAPQCRECYEEEMDERTMDMRADD